MRKSIGIVAAAAAVLALCVSTPFSQQASALSAGLSFSATDLPTWQANGEVYGLAGSNGLVVAGGTFTQISPPSGGSGTTRNQAALAVFNAETGSPASCQFTLAMAGGSPGVYAALASNDGNTVYIGGNFSSINGTTALRVAQIDPTACTVKPLRVASISSTVKALALSPDGSTLYFGGDFTSVGGQPRGHFAAVNATTGALLPWSVDAEGTAGDDPNQDPDGAIVVGRAIAVSPDGTKVAVGGHFFTVNGQNSHGLGVVDATTGANLANYPDGFIPHTSVIHALVTDGNAFYAGAQGTGGGVFDGSFKIDWTTLQQVWRDNCLGATQAILPYRGTLYEASHHHDCSSMNEFPDGKRYYFTANTEEDSTMLGWFPLANDGIGEHIGPRALAAVAGKTTGKTYLWAGGEFTLINGHAQQGFTRFGPDDVSTPPTPLPTVQAMSTGNIQVRFRSVYDPDDSLITYNVYRNGGTTPVWTGTATSSWWKRPQVTFVDKNVTPGTVYSYRVSATDAANNTSNLSGSASARAATPASDYAAQVIKDGANLYWRYDETSGTWLQDKSGSPQGLNGIYEKGAIGGAPGAIPGDPSTAANFNGSTQYAWSDQLAPGPTTYSIETWFKTGTTAGGKIVGYGNGQPSTLDTRDTHLSSSYDRQIYMDNAGRLIFGVYVGSTQVVTTGKSYNDNAWHYVVGTQGPSGLVLYVDGVRVGTNPTTTAQSYYGSWRVGGDNLNGWPNQPSSNFFQGSIDDTAIYPAPLTAQQVAQHYTLAGGTPNVNPAPKDAYGAAVYNDNPDFYWRLNETSGSVAADSSFYGGTTGAYGPSVQLGQQGIVGQSIAVTGSQDSTVGESAPVSSPASFSTEAWFKTGTTTGGKIIGFENTQTGNGSNYDKQTYMTNDGSLIFGIYNGGFNTVTSGPGFNDNKWHHVVSTQDGSGMKMYIDGTLIGTSSMSTNQQYTGYWRLGGGNLGGWPSQPSNMYFTGQIDEAAVYSTALSQQDVTSHYSLGIQDNQPPTVPANLTATLSGTSAVLNWDASTDNTSVAGYRVYRDASADFTVSDANKVADVTGTTWTDTAVPGGTSYYKVVAVDGAGNASAPSAPASITAADTTAPSVPTGLTASVSGTSAALSWTASTDDVGVTGYTVYRGSSADFTADASSKIGTATGTSYTDNGLAVGTYYYKVTASDAAGNVSGASAAASAQVQPAAPTVLTASPTDDAMVYKNYPTTNYGSNTQLSSNAGASVIESFLKFNVPAAPSGTVLSGATLSLRTSTDPTAGSADTHTLNLVNSGTWDQSTVTWNTRPTDLGAVLGTLSGATATNTPYTVTLDPSVLRTLVGTTVSMALSSTGTDNLRLWSSESTIASYRPLLTLSYTTGTLPPADTTAPSAPTGLTATVSGSSVALGWTASTDNVGVTGYTVYRGSSAGFTADASSKIGTASGTSYTDSGLAAGTYYYKVTAADAAGNVSGASDPASATVAPAPPQPTVLAINPTEDAMVYQANPSTNYGSLVSLSANGSPTAIQSFLKFALPAAPTGTTLTGATLQMRTTTDASAASADPHTFQLATGDWTEGTITWANRPTALGAVLGTMSGTTATNTPYTTTIDASQLSGSLGSTVTVALVAASTAADNVRLWSKEASAASYRPVLTLTFTP